MKENKIFNIIFFYLLLITLKKRIICKKNNCFEYSCRKCNTSEYGNCTQCEYSWELVDGVCPCSDSSCALCMTGFAGLEICLLCKNGYTLDNYECKCNILNCQQCGENKCLYCQSGYFYNNTSNECEKLKDENNITCYDPYCDTCFSELKGACVNCKEGFNLEKGKCTKLVQVNEKGKCPNKYYMSENYCWENCEGVDCPIQISSIRSLCPSNRCLVCREKELMYWSECDNSAECSSIKGCLNCISDSECFLCNQGYYLLGGLCYKCINGCSICTNNHSCEYCLSGFELTSDKQCNLTYNFDFDIDLYNKYKDELNNQTCSDENCLYCSFKYGIEQCHECRSGYDSYGKICLKCPNNCLNCFYYEYTGYCTKCISGYNLTNNGKCFLPCSDENCLECNLSGGKEYCTKCKAGYKINEEKCSLCSDWNGCVGCYFQNRKEYCKECKSHYYLKDGNCTRCSDEKCYNCIEENGIEYCKQCDESYYLKDNNCTRCTDHLCKSCYLLKGKEYCNECYYSNYMINEEKCIKCSDEQCLSCMMHYGEEECSKCENGYKINGKNCSLCSKENCLDCHFYNGQEICDVCKFGYAISIGGECLSCKLIDENCLSCNFKYETKCKECKFGYKLENGKCSLIYSDINICEKRGFNNCKYCDTKQCIECLDHYEFDYYNLYCKKKKNSLKTIIIIVVLFSIIIILLIIIFYIKRRKNRNNEVRIAQNNINNNNHNTFIAYRNIREITSSDKIYEKNLSNEFNRQKIKLQKNKMCQICKKNIGKYIGDCGCIVCQKHSNLENVIKKEENYKFCPKCGKMIKNLSLIKNNCHICLQEVLSVCHFKCGCAIEVCENCYINCKKKKKKCPGCRANI